MRLIKSPNRWSCLPTAFAMAMEVDLDTIIREVGHDGSRILFPKLPEPHCRRSFHIQELIRVAWDYGFGITEFQATCIMSPNGLDLHEFDMPISLQGYGVLTGQGAVTRHAVAFKESRHWDKTGPGTIYDPNGTVYAYEDSPIKVDTYYRFYGPG